MEISLKMALLKPNAVLKARIENQRRVEQSLKKEKKHRDAVASCAFSLEN